MNVCSGVVRSTSTEFSPPDIAWRGKWLQAFEWKNKQAYYLVQFLNNKNAMHVTADELQLAASKLFLNKLARFDCIHGLDMTGKCHPRPESDNL